MEIKVSGFIVSFEGDRTAGIFDQTWNITGDFYFESNEELEAFREKLSEAFEYYADTPTYIYTTAEMEEGMKDFISKVYSVKPNEVKPPKMRVFKIVASETDHFCGKTLVHALRSYLDDTDAYAMEVLNDSDDIVEVPESEWTSIVFTDENGNDRTIKEYMDDSPRPGIICSTAY